MEKEIKTMVQNAIKAYFKALPKDEKLNILNELTYYFNVDETDEMITVLMVFDSEKEYEALFYKSRTYPSGD